MEEWIDINNDLPKAYELVKVRTTDDTYEVDYINLPLNIWAPFQHYNVSKWRYLTEDEVKEIFNKIK